MDPVTVTVCICTYKRPELLGLLLAGLVRQETAGRLALSVVVVDNDAAGSARAEVERRAAALPFPVLYQVEPQQNIAMARNRAVGNATGEYLAFIDDDEMPRDDWLVRLLEVCEARRVAGVLAPVRPQFEDPPPAWAVRSGLYERPEYPTGTVLPWRETRTGNALVRRSAVAELDPPFQTRFGNGGEDQDFFRRLIEKGHVFVWCNEAPVYELVPRARMTRKYMLKRALLRGQNEKHKLSATSLGKSAVATVAYVVLLPFLYLAGEYLAMRYLVRLCDHLGKLLAAVGINPLGKKYLTG